MFALIHELVDAGSFFEVKKLFAQEVITGLGRIGGRPVGVVANQPKYKGGVLFVDSADKASRFIRCATPSTSPWSTWPTSRAS